MLSYVAVVLAAYLLGSIPTGFLVARARGVDIRSVGSGNMGATNVFRVLGKGAGIFVLLVDALKGVAGCRLAPWVASWIPDGAGSISPERAELFLICGGVAAILGHNYTCWLGFKGGKGVATTAGVLAALLPMVFLAALGLFAVIFAVTRYVSLASIVAAAALPLLAWFMQAGGVLTGVMAGVGALAIYKHRSNIRRLREGTENRFGSRSPQKAPPEGGS